MMGRDGVMVNSRSWIVLDSSGNEIVLDVDKYAVMRRVQIHARDLRILDPLLNYPSTILGRENAIVVNLEHIRVIITAQEVLLRDPLDDNVIPVVEELRRRLTSLNVVGEEDEQTPFEFRVLEVALEAICSFLDARTIEMETSAYPAVRELTRKISSRTLDKVRKLKSGMTRLTARVQKVSNELGQLLDDDDDMADLYLSRKLSSASPLRGSGPASQFLPSVTIGSMITRASRESMTTICEDENDVEELEMLLEAYYMQIDGTLSKLTALREYIEDTEDYINIQLDNHRNQLIQLELIVSSGNVSLTIYAMVTAIFGMNLQYTWRDNHGFMFKWVTIVAGIACAVLFILIISYSRLKGLLGSRNIQSK